VEAEANQRTTALKKWQIEEIKKGVSEADHGDFASEEEMQRMVKKWKLRGAKCP
jgi:predicted transcriptional regulator